ncbi:phosphoribosylanthranilate isomerase [Pseudohaliea rubra]|uniref:N-(5'-phosphoribosyl)anthranilate isomerase n=1 Tax=Pseudohaliea rubra DSM 19751 TaxID=1265313 RepID=A0A095XX78_9GAMM|nr:phosphoribosylanthranilate isomerase [Pseudohaliea rubra]KGE04306.1 Phosphoribosylanthranilate isomerase [Pseudohaliea rubra DSM 19751]
MALTRTRIKVCGITRPEDAVAAADAGVDAIGLVFHRDSPRAVSPAQAALIARAVGPLVTVVALFVDAAEAAVQEVLAAAPVGLLQFHGAESAAACGRYHRPYLKALRMAPGLAVEAVAEGYDRASGILLDSFRPGVPGGTGEAFDWDRVPVALRSRLVLAGGLTPANVGDAIARVGPAAVDVSGGVEAAPGLKDATRIAAFVAAVRAADSKRQSGSKP